MKKNLDRTLWSRRAPQGAKCQQWPRSLVSCTHKGHWKAWTRISPMLQCKLEMCHLKQSMMSNLFDYSIHESHENVSLYLTLTDDWRRSNQLTKGVASYIWSQLICQWHIDHHGSPSNFLWPECWRRASSMRKVLWPVRITKASVRST